ncbi:hypothetical protein D3C81_2295030 [compost metagenome]
MVDGAGEGRERHSGVVDGGVGDQAGALVGSQQDLQCIGGLHRQCCQSVSHQRWNGKESDLSLKKR